MRLNAARARALCIVGLLLALAPPAAPAQTARSKARPAADASERWLERLASRADFDRMARVYTDQPYALPHVIFVIDRKGGDKIYYANSRRYRFHKDFVSGAFKCCGTGYTACVMPIAGAERRSRLMVAGSCSISRASAPMGVGMVALKNSVWRCFGR